MGSLTEKNLKTHPVWTWSDDRSSYRPYPHIDPLLRYGDDFFIKARFKLASGHMCEGCIGLGGGACFYVELWIKTEIIGFGLTTQDLWPDSLKRLAMILSIHPNDILPIRYETDIHYEGEDNIAGVFDDSPGGVVR